ncbi:M48 family metalloprotease [Hyphococcus flavus]|uniref:M48 family metalloprotease n=1 Tax=Hyphococcus flavus TaxID=1866326 RepID=A0AAF0CFF5_9PROT|nr:M48 family metalloprotease [Hyphococcus flavus]WDI30868.1 M48 family metalloprotease [Hyphococcus flavus]
MSRSRSQRNFFRRMVIAAMAAATAVAGPAAQAQGISLLRDAEIEKYLEDYSWPIFEAAGLPPSSIEILIVNDQSINAFAGGRYMGMNSGMITFVETPNELEAVIAHEAGHLKANHSTRTQDAASNAGVPMLVGLVLAAGAVAAGAPDAGLGLFSLGQTVGTANFLKYSRGQESTADQLSITFLDRVGHSSQGALDLWGRMRNSQIITGNRINPYFQTHPMANTRLSALKERAQESPYFEKEDSPEEIHRLRLIQAKIKGFLQEPNQTLREYPLSDQSEPAHYARSIAHYKYSDIENALKEVRTLTEAHPDNPYYRELEGQILFEYGRTLESIEPHRRTIELVPDNALFRINLGRALLGAGGPEQLQEAEQELKRATILERDNSYAWFELARVYGAQGKEPLADLATAESRFHLGAKADANRFARRAMRGIRRGTPEWRQAADIIMATQPEGGGQPLPTGVEEDAPKPLPAPEEKSDRPDVPDPIVINEGGR